MTGGRAGNDPGGAVGRVARGSLTVAGWTLFCRATGLVRVVAVGAVLGPTFLANAFGSTNQVPNLTFEVLAGPVLALVLVPALVRATTGPGTAPAVAVFGRVTRHLLLASAVVTAAVVVLAPVFGRLLTLGVPAELRAPAAGTATTLVLLVAPQIVLYTLAYLGAAAAQSRERFAIAAAAPAVENLGLVAVLLVCAQHFGPGHEVTDVPAGLVATLGLGSTAAVAAHAALQLFAAARAGLPLRPRAGREPVPEAREVVLRLRASVGVAAWPALGVLGLLAAASTVPGGVPVFQIAYVIGAFPTALGARAVTTAVLPGLSAAVEQGDGAGFAAGLRRATGYVALVCLPAMCLLVVLAGPLAEVLAAGELRTPETVGLIAATVAVIGVSQVFGGLYEIGRQAQFARLDVTGPRIASVAGLAATVVVGAAALLLPAGAPRLAGLCAAVLARDAVAAAVTLLRLRPALRPEPIVDGRMLAVAAGAAAATVPVLLAGVWLLRAAGPDGVGAAVALAVVAAAGTAVFAATARVAWPRVVTAP